MLEICCNENNSHIIAYLWRAFHNVIKSIYVKQLKEPAEEDMGSGDRLCCRTAIRWQRNEEQDERKSVENSGISEDQRDAGGLRGLFPGQTEVPGAPAFTGSPRGAADADRDGGRPAQNL